jgi:hypothetical protein
VSRHLSYILVILCTLSVVCYCQERPEVRPGLGDLKDGVYTNDYFGLTYRLGKDWYLSEEFIHGDAGKVINRVPGQYLLLSADRQTGKPIRERILMIADDARQYQHGFTAKQYVTKMTHALIKPPGTDLVREAYAVEYGGKAFNRADYEEKYAGGSLSKAFVSRRVRGYLLSWTFVANSQEELDVLVNSLAHLSFLSAPKHSSSKP